MVPEIVPLYIARLDAETDPFSAPIGSSTDLRQLLLITGVYCGVTGFDPTPEQEARARSKQITLTPYETRELASELNVPIPHLEAVLDGSAKPDKRILKHFGLFEVALPSGPANLLLKEVRKHHSSAQIAY